MNKEEFIGKLEMVYVGDRNAFNEIVEDNQKLKNEVVYSKVEIENLKNIISSIKEDYLIEKAKIDKILDYLDTKFMQGLNYSEWTDGYNQCIKRHKSNFQNILQGDD